MRQLFRAKITSKGRITIPIEIREQFGFRPGDVVVFEELDGRLTFRRLDRDEERRWVARHIAETADLND